MYICCKGFIITFVLCLLFQKFGDVAGVDVLRERDSGNSKGFGYVRFHRPYHAALALENCDRSKKISI